MTVEITSMPASSSSSTSCHRFSWPRCRGRWCGPARRPATTCGRAGRGRRRGPSPRAPCPGSRTCGAARPRGPRSARRCWARPWVSTQPDDDVGAPRTRGARPSLQHGVGLADAGRGAEVDAELAACHCTSCRSCADRSSVFAQPDRLVEGQVELEHVDPGLAEEAERPARRCASSTRASTSSSCTRPRASATRGAWRWALATEMWGSRPEPEAVTASTGTSASVGRGRSPRGRRRRARSTASSRSGFVGPRLEAPDAWAS